MATAVVLCSACGKKDASVNDVTQAAQASSTEAENLYKEGSQYVGEEDYESAIESLLQCIELDPDYSKAYIQLSKAYIGNEEYDEAMSILQQGYEKTKDTSLEKEQDNCVRTICQVLTDNEDYETAIPWLLKLQELDGVTAENSLQLAEAYSMMDDYENAVSVLQKADQNDASIKNALLEARVAYGQYCYDEGKNDQAIETLKAVINEAPDRNDAYSMLIGVYVDAGKVKEAESIVQSGLERFVNQNSTVTDDQLDEFLNSASSYYLELEDVDACLRFWEKAVSMRPGNKSYKEELDSYRSSAADGSYAKADELREAGDGEGASKYYKRAFALAPSNYDAGVISGGVTNVILDYVYIFILKWGMGGAALATANGTTLTVLILASHFFSKDNHWKLEFSEVWRRVPEVLGNGLASFILEISNGFVMLLFNRQLLTYVGEMGITVYGIITNTALVASSISNGIAQAVQPLLSANFGAGNLKRVGEARKLGVRTGFAAGFIFTAIGMLIPVQLSYLFLDPTPEILTMAVPAIRLYFLCFLVSEWNIISGMYFQSTVRPRFSLTITLLRGVILNSVFVFLLPALFGVDGIWFTVTVSEFITAGVAFVLMKREKH